MSSLLARLTAILLPILSLHAQEGTESANTHSVFQFENEYVKVWKSVIAPNEPVDFYRHECGSILVGLKDGVLNKVDENGEVEVIAVEAGKAFWIPSERESPTHSDVNVGADPLEVMFIEVKAAEAAESSEADQSTEDE